MFFENNVDMQPTNKDCGQSGMKLDDGWPESEKDVFQVALSMAVVKKQSVNGWRILYELWRDKL